MIIPPEHKALLSKKSFKLKCNQQIFTEQELEFFYEFGHWLEALAQKTIEPITTKQSKFIVVADGDASPTETYEKLWVKYLKRLAWEKENQDVTKYEWKDPSETLCSRKDIEKIRSFSR